MSDDERERLIDLKAQRLAYYVFAIGAFGGIFITLHVIDASSVAVGTIVFISFVLSQIVKHAARLVYYRHGV